MSEDAKRVAHMMQLIPEHWDKAPLILAHEIRAFLMSVKDEGTGIDSGGGDGDADLWVKVQGVEYYINIRKSNTQLLKEGHTRESLGLPPLPPDGEGDQQTPEGQP